MEENIENTQLIDNDLKFAIVSLGSVSSKMVADEAKKYFSRVDLVDLRKIEILVDNKKTTVLYDGEPFREYDALYLKGSYKYADLLYGLTEIYKNKCFIPIDSSAHIVAHNKFMTHLNFSSQRILKMPTSYFAAKISEAKRFLNTLSYPIILKFPSGTHGKGVIFADSAASAKSMVDALDVFKQPVIVQDYIDIKSDIRVIVAGNKIIGSMRRIAKGGEVRANAHQGGSAEPFIVTPEIKQMCLEAAKKIKAQLCAIDIIESDYGPLILEVNTSPGLQKITEVTKKNIAGEIAKFFYEETQKRRVTKEKLQTRDVMGGLGVEEIGSRDFETQLDVRSGKIILPEFVYKMTNFKQEENVIIKVSKNKIELIRDDSEDEDIFY